MMVLLTLLVQRISLILGKKKKLSYNRPPPSPLPLFPPSLPHLHLSLFPLVPRSDILHLVKLLFTVMTSAMAG